MGACGSGLNESALQRALTCNRYNRQAHLICCRPLLLRSVRMQKLEALKEARAAGTKRQVEDVDAAAAAAADAIADPEVERPTIQLAKKRRVGGMAALAGAGACRPVAGQRAVNRKEMGWEQRGGIAPDADPCLQASLDFCSSCHTPLPRPVPQVADTIAALEAGSSSDEEDAEGDELLDWRAKKSAF